MDPKEIAFHRLKNQQLASTDFQTPKQLVGWMGAMQAQDYNHAKWAIGVRLPHLTDNQIEDAFNRGEILRTHIMRPTWHFVSADDIYWMLELTSPQIRAVLNSRHRDLGITEFLVNKCYLVIEEALNSNEGQVMTREELLQELDYAGIPTDLQRASHFMLRAEIDGIVCSGPLKAKKQTYALLSKRVPERKTLTKEEALAKLAKSYFLSHGPATVADFAWWSGLSATEARKGLETIKNDLISVRIASDTYWYSGSSVNAGKLPDSVYLLPAYDEFLISYKNRNASITEEDHKKAISSNGIFRPVVLVNGQISGLWEKVTQKGSVMVETEYFRPHNKTEEQLLIQAVQSFGNYTGKKVEITIE
ncbi:MAG TPA: winged helix DNA-binding domain-containing protein [Prolixibacteraceae bacterium]|nr:winged helix DNA-binding domain-containing protein [Prolixibacteraceae bacterium]